LGFDTGGLNLDTAIGLQLAVGARARLAAQFLALPVGRDMMLWNIIVGVRGLYAIDQEVASNDRTSPPPLAPSELRAPPLTPSKL
jgi:hypothetical protein